MKAGFRFAVLLTVAMLAAKVFAATSPASGTVTGRPLDHVHGRPLCRLESHEPDATIDKRGRVVVGYDDGCISQNCIAGVGLIAGNDFTAKAVIARQASGKRMYAAFDHEARADVDPQEPPPPPPPATTCGSVVATDPAGDAAHPLLSSNGGTLNVRLGGTTASRSSRW